MPVAAEPTFADRLKELREAAGLSQYALAQKSGVSGQAIAFLERGERQPGWDTVRKLSRALGVPVSEFDVGDPPGLPTAGEDLAHAGDAAELPEVLPEVPTVPRGKYK